MADNVNVTPGVGKVIAADEVAGILHQRVKLVLGDDGISDGDVSSTNPMPVNVNGGSIDVVSSVLPTGAATAAKQDTGNTSLASIDGKITTVNTGAVVVASSALPTGAATESTLSSLNTKVTVVNTGAVVVASSALPTGAATESTLSSLNTKVTAVDTGAVVVASSALPTGAATESTLSSLNSKVIAVDTGAVSVTSSALPTGAATSAKQPNFGSAGGPSSEVITIQGVASMTPVAVSGTITATPSGTQDENLTQIAGNTVLTGNGVTGTGSQRVTIASDQTPFPVKAQDGAGNNLTSTLTNGKQALDIRTQQGFSTAGNTRVAIVTTPTTTILAANANRRSAYIANNSGATVFIKLGAAAVANQGIRLPANAVYEINDTNLFTGSIDAIGAGDALDIFEGT